LPRAGVRLVVHRDRGADCSAPEWTSTLHPATNGRTRVRIEACGTATNLREPSSLVSSRNTSAPQAGDPTNRTTNGFGSAPSRRGCPSVHRVTTSTAPANSSGVRAAPNKRLGCRSTRGSVSPTALFANAAPGWGKPPPAPLERQQAGTSFARIPLDQTSLLIEGKGEGKFKGKEGQGKRRAAAEAGGAGSSSSSCRGQYGERCVPVSAPATPSRDVPVPPRARPGMHAASLVAASPRGKGRVKVERESMCCVKPSRQMRTNRPLFPWPSLPLNLPLPLPAPRFPRSIASAR
jgi:hypothetical protein